MKVGDWLHRLGLPQYEKPFAENAIDGELLQQLTVDDLKALGVGLLGHRRKLLTAIEALRSGGNRRDPGSLGEERSLHQSCRPTSGRGGGGRNRDRCCDKDAGRPNVRFG
jgi:hypothetical protein